jgi:hypothetical protein
VIAGIRDEDIPSRVQHNALGIGDGRPSGFPAAVLRFVHLLKARRLSGACNGTDAHTLIDFPDPMVIRIGDENIARRIDGDSSWIVEQGSSRRTAVSAESGITVTGDWTLS